MMGLNDELRQLILTSRSSGEVREVARRYGLRTLNEDGWRILVEGATTVDEVLRVTKDERPEGVAVGNGH